jgi:hypothetical protein
MANTPRRLVSSGRRPSAASSPVNTNPLLSSAMPDWASQLVFGAAPISRNR